MRHSGKLWHFHPFRYSALVAGLILVAIIPPVARTDAAEPITLEVKATHGLPGLHHSALSRFLATRMTEAGIANWRFQPAGGETSARDRVEWTFRLNPYAGGEVRNFARALASEWGLAIRRPVTIEARLYLNGEYQTLVERQAVIRGGPDDPDLASAVASVTENLLGPSGAAYQTITRQFPASQAR